MIEVAGAQLSLRYPVSDDVPALFARARDPEVTRHFSWGPYRAIEEAEAFVASLPSRRRRGEALELLVVHEDHGPIGLTGLFELARRDRRCVVGTWFGRRWWGTGVNARSKALVLALAFETLGMDRVTAWAGTDNRRSQAALARLGFSDEGVLRAWHRHNGAARDVAAFSLLRDEWERSALRRSFPAVVKGRPPRAFAVR